MELTSVATMELPIVVLLVPTTADSTVVSTAPTKVESSEHHLAGAMEPLLATSSVGLLGDHSATSMAVTKAVLLDAMKAASSGSWLVRMLECRSAAHLADRWEPLLASMTAGRSERLMENMMALNSAQTKVDCSAALTASTMVT